MKLLEWLDEYFSKNELETINKLKRDIKVLEATLELREDTIFKLGSDIQSLQKSLLEAKEMSLKDISDAREEAIGQFLNNNRNHYNSYSKIHLGKRLTHWCRNDNDKTPLITGTTYDDIANNCLIETRRMVKYVIDPKENWQTANETITRKAGDCEDGAILLYNMMVASGIPVHRVRLNAGDVKGGGHAYVTYYSDLKGWVILDWCYWFNESVGLQKTWQEAEKYFGIWFSWNEEYVWEDIQDGGAL